MCFKLSGRAQPFSIQHGCFHVLVGSIKHSTFYSVSTGCILSKLLSLILLDSGKVILSSAIEYRFLVAKPKGSGRLQSGKCAAQKLKI